MPGFFSGHRRDGEPLRDERPSHLAFHCILPDRLLVLAPHVLDGRSLARTARKNLELLDEAVTDLIELRAGSAGVLGVRREDADLEADPLFACSTTWKSVTPYAVNRHAKMANAADALVQDVQTACRDRGLPAPAVTVLRARGVPGRGLEGDLALRFPVAVRGPMALGRTRFLGGGLFVGTGA